MFQYIAAGLGVAVLVTGGIALHQRGTIADLKADVVLLESRAADKDATIERQANATRERAKIEAENAEKAKAAGERITALSNELAAERAKRRAARESDDALPGCSELLAVDLATVCPARARGLRDAASGVP